jgi:uncharacterized protein YcbX
VSEIIAEGRVSALYRYPVKSMQGEQLHDLQLTGRGVDGDRVLALLDRADGLVASAHHPAKWGQLLHCRARTASDRKVWVTLPGGRELPAGAELERELGTLLGQDVRLISSAPDGGAYEIIHPDVPGTAPPQFVKHTLNLAGPQRRVGRLELALEAELGTLVDVAPVHLITSAALATLTARCGDGDPRRYRPNIVLDLDAEGYVENEWAGCKIAVGGACLHGMFPTPRCIVPTLPQHGVTGSKRALQTLARDNRIPMRSGNWACLGLYARVSTPGAVRSGAHSP